MVATVAVAARQRRQGQRRLFEDFRHEAILQGRRKHDATVKKRRYGVRNVNTEDETEIVENRAEDRGQYEGARQGGCASGGDETAAGRK